jgi:hypothetical protein
MKTPFGGKGDLRTGVGSFYELINGQLYDISNFAKPRFYEKLIIKTFQYIHEWTNFKLEISNLKTFKLLNFTPL